VAGSCGEQDLFPPGELPAATPGATGRGQQKGLGKAKFGLRRAKDDVWMHNASEGM